MRIVYSDKHALHAPASIIVRGRVVECPEKPERAWRLLAALTAAGHAVEAPQAFGLAPVAAVHGADYLDFLEHGHAAWRALPDGSPEIVPNAHPGRHMGHRPQGIVGLAGYHLGDTSCPIGAGTWEAARAGADCALTAAALVRAGEPHAYALCRPPGHHAFVDQAGGFCYLNNVAIAANRSAQDLGRVAILDIDVHHGNGTQGIFYARGDVFFCSTHGDPSAFYPFFSGYADERGRGEGEGATLNLPLAPGSGDDKVLAAVDQGLAAIARFAPAVLLVSLGLDAQEHDPLGILKVTTAGFARIAERIAALALPTVLIQEGGYLCDELGANVASFLGAFEASHRFG